MISWTEINCGDDDSKEKRINRSLGIENAVFRVKFESMYSDIDI